MKVKRNKRVEENLRIRTARLRDKRRRVVSPLAPLQDSLAVRRAARRKRPKSFLTLLEQDLAARAERLQRLESAFVMEFTEFSQAEFGQPALEPVMVTEGPLSEPVEESSSSMVEESRPSEPTTQPLANGRTNYQYTVPSKRVRRRVISL